MSDESYQGYSNRETFALSLWLNNDEFYYGRVQEMIAEVREDSDDSVDQKYELADKIEQFWDEITDFDTYEEGLPETILTMIQDVGSLWRVDFHEIAESELAG